MALTWAGFEQLVRDGKTREISTTLLTLDEPSRRVLAAELPDRIRAAAPAPGEQVWGRSKPGWSPGAFALAVIACAPTAARAAALLGRREMRQWHTIRIDRFLEIARARQLSWVGELGVRLAQRVPAGELTLMAEWDFVFALLDEGKAAPPATEAVVRGWINRVDHRTPGGLVGRLRVSPYLDALLPAVFEIDGLGAHLPLRPASFPAAVARLCAEGRLERAVILAATVDRLLRGDRPGAVRPFLRLHEELAPVGAEILPLVPSYAGLLDGPSPVASLAQKALRTVDGLDQETLLEISRVVLARPEKGLVTAQLSWLDTAARRDPSRAAAIVEVVAEALASPVLDVQERARAVIERWQPSTSGSGASARPASGAGSAVRPSPPGPAASAPTPASAAAIQPFLPTAAAVMPAPIGSAVELAEEFVALLRERTAVRWERVMAAVVSLPADGFGEALEPVLSRNDRSGRSRVPALDEAIRARAGLPLDPRQQQRLRDVVRHPDANVRTPADLLELRLTEIAVRVTESPIPELLATPTRVTGSIDPGVLIDRLARLEAEGAVPWPLDFQQALLRLPRMAGPARQRTRSTEWPEFLARAEALTSPHGRRLVDWLRAGGLPDPVSIRFEQRDPVRVDRRLMVNLWPGPGDLGGLGGLGGLSGFSGWSSFGGLGRLGADLGGLRVEDAVVALARRPELDYGGWASYRPDVLAMTLPHHREAVAAWALPDLAGLADLGERDASLLPLLADADGPLGPAVVLGIAYGLGARHSPARVAAVDAFLALAEQAGAGFAAAVGAELGDLCSDGTVKLTRVVEALTDAQAAGAAAAVWQLLAAALPRLLTASPRGLPDMLQLATITITAGAGEVGAGIGVATVPGLAAVAGRSGGSRLLREARRLRAAVEREI
ncbi:DUF6493 family protein [Actinoplanes missouriensis]|uniref:DUF6493 family protein n=1 Tax=Actinoplanes missouriensis TaxID=1866 RepID=UPI0033D41F6C